MPPPQQEMTPEQQEELRKKLEAMGPEELKEFQKKQCIFCHIIAGKVAAKKIFENDKVLAVLDINPANPGHILLMPKEHYMIMPQMPDSELANIFMVAKQLSNVLLKALDVRGTNIVVANGGAAGQRAQHFMLHIIPRKEGDGVAFNLPSKTYTEQELDATAQLVKKWLEKTIGIKEKPKTAQDILKEKTAAPKPSKVVEAEFKEEAKKEVIEKEEKKIEKEAEESNQDENLEEHDEEDKSLEAKAEKPKKKEKKKREEAKKETKKESDDIDLDSIARLLNG